MAMHCIFIYHNYDLIQMMCEQVQELIIVLHLGLQTFCVYRCINYNIIEEDGD